jgi:hypothetical protein
MESEFPRRINTTRDRVEFGHRTDDGDAASLEVTCTLLLRFDRHEPVKLKAAFALVTDGHGEIAALLRGQRFSLAQTEDRAAFYDALSSDIMRSI